ncbi:MAG: transposase [Bacillota bacterium]|nr:transposase [Bacillota bacterium]
MIPNENFLKYFPETQLPEEKDRINRSNRSSCIQIGGHIIIKKIIKDYKISEILDEYFDDKELGLLLDLVSYSIISESNANQYYPDYAYNHPLFTNDMRIYSDSKISDFLNSITENQCLDFLNSWNERRNHREKLYFSYDSTNKNCQAGDIEIVEFGKSKVNTGAPIFNYAIAYDNKNSEPLFYEKYPGSITDVSQLKHMVDKARGYGYKNIGFILDRGYFSKKNIEYMDSCGYSFIIMMKGMKSLVKQLILEHKGNFESKRIHNIFDYGVYGKSVKRPLYELDEKERCFHIYHSIFKESYERRAIELKINELSEYLKKHQNTKKMFSSTIEHYFDLYYENELFLFATEKARVIEEEMALVVILS